MEKRRVTKTKLIFGFLVALYASITCTCALDTISVNQTVRYGKTIVSSEETFELGFFLPGKSTNYYVGIWYKKILNQTVVWVVNPNTPLRDTSSELTLTHQGFLIIRNTTTGNVIWSLANSTTLQVRNPIGQLLDTGNFIIYEKSDVINQENPIWQSFDFLQNTLLPGMKLGWNLVTGKERHLTSWKSDDDPAFGDFSYGIDIHGYPQAIITKGQKVEYRGGPWNGVRFTGTPKMSPNTFYTFTFVLNEREIYYQYTLVNHSVFTRLVLQSGGRLDRLVYMDSKQEWEIYYVRQNDLCDQYSVCGPFERCKIENSQYCECLKGFEPISGDRSQGCRHTIPLNCNSGEGFNKYTNLKLPDTRESWYNETMTGVECKNMCKRNCSCSAYAHLNISGTGNGCLLWSGNLTDIRTFVDNGDTLYIRFSASELDSTENNKSSSVRRRVRVIVPVALAVLVILGYPKTMKEEVMMKIWSYHYLACLRYFKLQTTFQSTTNLERVAMDPCTSGYMAPEYAGDGIFSIKSDVYSFGVLVLEIVCGEKNRGFVNNEHCSNLIGHAWRLHNEGRSLQLVAECLVESIEVSQVQRSIHVGLLCVQRHPEDRPTMTSVIMMLESESPLPVPKEPGYYVEKTKQHTAQSSSSYATSSNYNEQSFSVSMLLGR
ncbi:hypothetical protein L1987_85036 [Smallanthus sonchifolius]|uniref:Uncharacterized protein n=1 Tax=Smallanthus sonchifolius TaxID=185202 RepID=A0ACB8XVZ8_9ASTR|nr:hypothetical protein L1987_85036 [Smallanthus sonchifolius]